MSDHEIWGLIQKYLADTDLPKERRKLTHWMNQHPDNRKLVQDVEKIWKMIPDEKFEVNVPHAWELFYDQKIRKARALQKNIETRTYPSFKPFFRKLYDSRINVLLFRLAAILLVSIITGYFVYHHVSERYSDQKTRPLVMEELITGKGEKTQVTFSDGTQVILNSAGSLYFPKEFDEARRVVYLQGEAYFNVAYSGSRSPFIVRSGDVDVEVLGTEFNVRGWSDDPGVEVVVRSGKVSVYTTDPEFQRDISRIVTLNGGYQTIVNKGNVPSIPREVVDIRNKLIWTTGGLYFDNTPFGSVIADLERRFNVGITVHDKTLLDIPFTSTFQYADLDEILRVIASAMEIGYKREGSEIQFTT